MKMNDWNQRWELPAEIPFNAAVHRAIQDAMRVALRGQAEAEILLGKPIKLHSVATGADGRSLIIKWVTTW